MSRQTRNRDHDARHVMTAGTRRAIAFAVVSVCALFAWFSAVPAASADTGPGVAINLPAHGATFSQHPTGSLINELRLYPGSSTSGVMGVRNDSSDTASVTLTSNNIVSSENGCVHPELAAPGGCHPGPGQLGDALRFTVATSPSQHGTYVTTWTGSAAGLASGVPISGDLAAHGTVWVSLTASLPWAAGNEVQTDTYGFDLRVDVQGPGGAAAGLGVAGLSVHAGGGGGHSGSGFDGLALTGVAIGVLGAAGLLFFLAGVLIWLGARDRRIQRA